MPMVQGACHCTGVRFRVARPDWVLDCNCTICRRYGALWTYPQPDDVEVVRGRDATDTYVWGDRHLAFHRCRVCGCVTYMTRHAGDPQPIYGVNARLIPTLDPGAVRIRQKDNGHTGFFWTRSTDAPEPSHHPHMDPPGPNDWR